MLTEKLFVMKSFTTVSSQLETLQKINQREHNTGNSMTHLVYTFYPNIYQKNGFPLAVPVTDAEDS